VLLLEAPPLHGWSVRSPAGFCRPETCAPAAR
jgi:hypothetical protein